MVAANPAVVAFAFVTTSGAAVAFTPNTFVFRVPPATNLATAFAVPAAGTFAEGKQGKAKSKAAKAAKGKGDKKGKN